MRTAAQCACAALMMLAAPAQSPAGNFAIPPGPYGIEQIVQLSKGLERVLAAKRVRVALIGRVGLPPEMLPPDIHFSHAAYAVYSEIRTADDRRVPGYAVYNLYQGEVRTGTSFLAQDYPVDYFATVHALEAGVVVPNGKLERALLETIFSQRYARLHNPRYSALANPFNAKYQNCTEFVLDVVFAAIYRTEDPLRLKANIAASFKPQVVHIDGFRLALAAASMPDVSIDDHSGTIATATFESIARFLEEHRLSAESFVFTIDPQTLRAQLRTLVLEY